MHNTWLEFLTPMVCRYVYNIHPVYWLLRDKKSGEPWKFYRTKNFRIFPEMNFLNFWSFIFFEICIDFAGTRLWHVEWTWTKYHDRDKQGRRKLFSKVLRILNILYNLQKLKFRNYSACVGGNLSWKERTTNNEKS